LIEVDLFGALSERVRREERVRFLSIQFAPSKYKADFISLLGFNLELRDACIGVSEPAIGQLRLKWWYDALPGIFSGNPPRHPVALGLAEVVARRRLRKVKFEQWIEAEAEGLADGQLDQISDIESQMANTTGVLIELSMAVVGIDDQYAREASRSVAQGCGLTDMLRCTAAEAARGRFHFPHALCQRHGLDSDAVIRWRPGRETPKGLVEVVAETAKQAAQRLGEARRMRRKLPERVIPLMLTVAPADADLRRLARLGNNPLEAFARPDPWLVVRLAWAAWWKRY